LVGGKIEPGAGTDKIRAMRRLTLLLCLLSLGMGSACTLWPRHGVVNTWTNATGGEGFERSFWRDVKEQNWTELDRHVASNYSLMTSGGRLDRAAALDYWKKYQIDAYSISAMDVELHGHTLVVTYSILLRGTFAGKPLPAAPMHVMAVWEEQKRAWEAIAHSWSTG
jgi:Domain of unknown function (DUF4440)